MSRRVFMFSPARVPCWRGMAIAVASTLAVLPAAAGTIIIGENGRIATGAGQIEAACSDVDINGDLAGSLQGARHVTLGIAASMAGAAVESSGNWVNDGSREVNAALEWRDGCGVTEASMLGSNDLTALHVSSDSGRLVRFDVDGEQRIGGNLSLTGSAGNRLRLRSTSEQQFARLSLEPGGSQQVSAVDVAFIDSSAGQEIAPGVPEDYESVRAGPVRNWFMQPAVPVPTLGVLSTVFLVLLMGLLGLLGQRSDSFGNQGVTSK